MAAALPTTVGGKTAMLARRQADAAAVERAAIATAIKFGAEEPPPSTNCFGRLWTCTPRAMRATRVSTQEVTAESVGSRMHSAANSGLLNRLVGSKKQSQAVQLEAATQTVAARVSELSDRASLARARAVAASKAGKKEEAIRELKKAKAVEKQLLAARTALATLEQQHDLVAETALQQELAVALKSTVGAVKKKQKGLLNKAEEAVDGQQELADDVADIAAVFEGLQPTGDADEDELLDELREMMGEEGSVAPEAVESSHAPMPAPVHASAFPSAPTSAVEQRRALLAGLDMAL